MFMNTIGKITEEIINRSPFLRESMTDNLINISALARKIQPEIENVTGKKVKEGAIVMAIKRMEPGVYHKINMRVQSVLSDLGDFIIRSNLTVFTMENSETLTQRLTGLVNVNRNDHHLFFSLCRGSVETTVVISDHYNGKMAEIIKVESLVISVPKLSSITVKMPYTSRSIHGFYYYILKQLAWEGINILEVVSTSNEFTIVVHQNEVDLAFKVLMQLKRYGIKELQ